MGIIGMLLLLGGLGSIVLGVIGVVANLFMGQYMEAMISVTFIIGGLVAGALAASILE